VLQVMPTKHQTSHPYQPLYEAHAEGRLRNVQLDMQLRCLEVDLARSRQEVVGLQNQHVTLSGRCSELEQSLMAAQASSSRSSARAAQATAEATTTQKQLKQVQLALQDKVQEVKQLVDRVQQLAAACKERDDALTAAEGRVGAAEGRATAAEGRATTAEGRTTAAQGRATTAEGRATEAEERAAAAEGRATTAEGRTASAESRAAAAEGQVNAMRQQLSALQQQHTQLQQDNARLLDRMQVIPQQEEALAAAAVAAAESQQTIEDFKKRTADMGNAIAALEEECRAAEGNALAAHVVTSNMWMQVQAHQEEVERVTQVLQDSEVHTDLAEAERSKQTFIDLCKKLDQQLQRATNDYVEQRQRYREQEDIYKRTIDRLQQNLKEDRASHAQSRKQLRKVSVKKAKLGSKLVDAYLRGYCSKLQ
jgi:hypothetical protein